MNRKRLTSDEADDLLTEMKQRVYNGESVEEVLWEQRVDAVFALDLMLD